MLARIKADFWILIIGFMLLGYLCMGRSFAYLGVRSLNLYIGEAALGLFLLVKTREILGKWFWALITEARVNRLAWAYYLFISYGVLQTLRGIIADYSPVMALQVLSFNVYPLYLFIGLWAGARYPHYLDKFMLWLAWLNGVYGVLFIAVLSGLSWDESVINDYSGQTLPLLGQPNGSATAIIGLLCFEKNLFRAAPPLLLNLFVLLGMQVRSQWLGFAVGLAVWGLLNKKMGRLLASAVLIVALLGVGYLTDFNIPAPPQRGGNISVRDIIGRAISSVDREAALNYSSHADATAGNVDWRKKLWAAIWSSVHETSFKTLFGHGYGFQITSLVTYIAEESNLRSPHNIFLFCLVFGGWIGVIIFFVFQLTILRLHWLTYKFTKNAFGLAFVAIFLTDSCFNNMLEAPFGAIPYYLISGIVMAPLCVATKADHRQS